MTSSRRAFLSGQWRAEAERSSCAEIASLIVSTWPRHLEEVSEAVLALGGTEIHGRDPIGKLIVVIEADRQGEVGAKANAIASLPHVLCAAMVFEASDNDARAS